MLVNRRCMTLASLALAAASLAQAQTAPAATTPAPAPVKGPVRITTVFPSGSGPDAVTRILAEKLQARWSQPVVVEAKPGAAGMVGINAVKGLPPTGQELVVVDVGNLSINPLVFKKLSYDPEKDLVPVAVLYRTAFFVTTSATGPVRSVKDLMAAATAAKDKPLNYGSNAVAGPIHLASERLAHAAGAEMVHVPYKELSLLYPAVANGEISWAFGSIASAGPLLRAGKLRFLAVADSTRSPALPDVPTLEEAGGPKGLYASTWVALMAPAGTPAPVADEINKAINEALAQPDVKQKLDTFGFTLSPGPAAQVRTLMRADRERYAEVVKRVNVSID